MSPSSDRIFDAVLVCLWQCFDLCNQSSKGVFGFGLVLRVRLGRGLETVRNDALHGLMLGGVLGKRHAPLTHVGFDFVLALDEFDNQGHGLGLVKDTLIEETGCE